MNKVVIKGNDEQKLLNDAMLKLNANVDEIVYYINENEFKKLFNKEKYTIIANTLDNVNNQAKDFLTKTIQNLGLNVNITSKVVEKKIMIDMDSNNNSILIGKNGKTLKSLEILVRQYIYNINNIFVNIELNVENYKEQKLKQFEKFIKATAKEVLETKIPVTLENMNSYERRIVHNIVLKINGVNTISEGEEPNRHVIIKPSK